MIKQRKESFLKILLLLLCVFLSKTHTYAQKDILLYATDFKDWGAVNSTESSASVSCTGGGEGFVVFAKPTIDPSSGKYCSNNSTNYIQFKPFTFISGGVVEVTVNVNKNGKTQTISGVTTTSGTLVATPATYPNATPTTITNTVFTSGKDYGTYTFAFQFSDSGTKTIKIDGNAKCGEIDITGIKVYSGVGAVPYVASTNYPQSPADGHTLRGNVGGAENSGVPVNSLVSVKAWNIGTHDVKLSIEGADAVKFSLVDDPTNGFALQADGTLIMSNAKATTGAPVNINFTPSVLAGISSALLKIEEIGGSSSPYYVNLTGLTGNATPQILTDTSTVAFWGSPISSTTKNLNLAGLNLSSDVTISISGTGASKFSVSPLSIPKQTALNGTAVKVTYTGDINSPTNDAAVLEIKSAGAPTVYVPLKGYTLDSRPEMLELKFAVSPAGAGIVKASPAGTMYLKGTTVAASVTPETGYSISYWDDAAGNHASSRSFRVTDRKQGLITIFLVKNTGGVVVTPSSSYVAFAPDELNNQLTSTGFLARWASLIDTDETTNPVTKYTVVIYDENGVELSRTDAGLTNSFSVTGLTPGAFYSYSVIATKTDLSTKTTPRVGLLQTTPIPTPFSCGN